MLKLQKVPITKDVYTIVHNRKQYRLDYTKLIRASDYFSEQYWKSKESNLEVNDMHSTEAFDIFFKILCGEQIMIDKKYKFEVGSLLKEWKCHKLLQEYDNTIHNGINEPKRIFLKLLNGVVHMVHIKSTDTLEQFHQQIEKLSGTPKKDHFLICHGQNLISDYQFKGLQNNDRVIMSKKPINVVPIYIKDMTGKVITIHINAHASIHDLQSIVCKRLNITFNECRLILNGMPLSIDRTMDDYAIKKEMTIHYILRQF